MLKRFIVFFSIFLSFNTKLYAASVVGADALGSLADDPPSSPLRSSSVLALVAPLSAERMTVTGGTPLNPLPILALPSPVESPGRALPLSLGLLAAAKSATPSREPLVSSAPLAFGISRNPGGSAMAVFLKPFKAAATSASDDLSAPLPGSTAPKAVNLLAPLSGAVAPWCSISRKEAAKGSWVEGPSYGIYTDTEYAEVGRGTRAENAPFDKLISATGKPHAPSTVYGMALPFLKNSKVGRRLVLSDGSKDDPKHDASAWFKYLQECYKHNPDAFYRNLKVLRMDWGVYKRAESFLGEAGLKALIQGLRSFYLWREDPARDMRLLIVDMPDAEEQEA